MNNKYIKEILLSFYEFYDLEIDENSSDKLIIYNKDEFYEIDEILTDELNISHEIESEYYDYLVIKFNLNNKSCLDSYYDLKLNKSEIKLYQKLLTESDEYKKIYNNTIGTNELNDYIHKFHMNHKNYYSYELDESDEYISEILSELISLTDNNKFSKYEIYSNLDELYNEYSENMPYDLFKLRNFRVNIYDESNIIIDRNSGLISNITEDIFKNILKEILTELFSDESKLDELIELYNLFDEINSYEILNNTEYNLNYISNKLFIHLFSFKKYSNQDEYIKLIYNKSDENISLNPDEIDSDELIDNIIYSLMYYESDSYEINEFIKHLKML